MNLCSGPRTRGDARSAGNACGTAISLDMRFALRLPWHLLLLSRVPGPGSQVPEFSR